MYMYMYQALLFYITRLITGPIVSQIPKLSLFVWSIQGEFKVSERIITMQEILKAFKEKRVSEQITSEYKLTLKLHLVSTAPLRYAKPDRLQARDLTKKSCFCFSFWCFCICYVGAVIFPSSSHLCSSFPVLLHYPQSRFCDML